MLMSVEKYFKSMYMKGLPKSSWKTDYVKNTNEFQLSLKQKGGNKIEVAFYFIFHEPFEFP